jgi:hypothetical protein
MSADPPVSDPVRGPRPRWTALPGDPPILTRWLARKREQAARYEPLPPIPEESS